MTQPTPPGAETQAHLIGDRELKVERIFQAPRERVWRAYTERDLVAQWWGRGNRLDLEHWELEPGGRWRIVEHHDGGSEGFSGHFREVTPMDRLSYSFEWDGMRGYVTADVITFEDLGDGRTKVTAHSYFHMPQERDGMMEYGMLDGLNQSYAALDRVLASME